MSVIEVLTHGRLLLACMVHAAMTVLGLMLLEWLIHHSSHRFLIDTVEHVVEPLYRAFILVLFIFIAYPVIYGIEYATPITALLADGENRTDYLINLVFLSSLVLPALPGIGKWTELILPVQGILCAMMVFSWLAQSMNIDKYGYWPGTDSVLMIVILALVTHWLTVKVGRHVGDRLDARFNVTGFEELIGQSVILFMQAPAILVYSLGLGRQLS